MRTNLVYLGAGALSGIFWFGLAFILDDGWAISPKPALPFFGSLVAASVTGLLVCLLFQGLFYKLPAHFFTFLPLITLPFALLTFAFLLWFNRQIFGMEFQPKISASHELLMIIETYVIGGLFSIFAPFLLVFSLVTQWMMRLLLRKYPQKSSLAIS